MGSSPNGRSNAYSASPTRPVRSSRLGWSAPRRCQPSRRWRSVSRWAVSTERLTEIARIRREQPRAMAQAAARRSRPSGLLGPSGRVMVIAADHPARGALRAGADPLAMADRGDLLDRLVEALSRPGVTGVLGTADIIEDLLLLGALENKVVVGSMNRGGLAGAAFELDDRVTGYDAATIE